MTQPTQEQLEWAEKTVTKLLSPKLTTRPSKALAAALAEREADGGWCADMENAPDHNGAAHFRAVEVLNNKTGQSHWDLHYGYIHDETGDFVDAENGDPFGWNAEDYTHFKLITLPPAKETE